MRTINNIEYNILYKAKWIFKNNQTVRIFYRSRDFLSTSRLKALFWWWVRRLLSDEEEHVRNMYNMALDLENGDNLCIDLPPDLGNGVDK